MGSVTLVKGKRRREDAWCRRKEKMSKDKEGDKGVVLSPELVVSCCLKKEKRTKRRRISDAHCSKCLERSRMMRNARKILSLAR